MARFEFTLDVPCVVVHIKCRLGVNEAKETRSFEVKQQPGMECIFRLIFGAA